MESVVEIPWCRVSGKTVAAPAPSSVLRRLVIQALFEGVLPAPGLEAAVLNVQFAVEVRSETLPPLKKTVLPELIEASK